MMCAYALWRKSGCAGSSGSRFEQAEAERPELGALVGEKAVEKIVEHCRYQLPLDQNSLVSDRLGTVLPDPVSIARARSVIGDLTAPERPTPQSFDLLGPAE